MMQSSRSPDRRPTFSQWLGESYTTLPKRTPQHTKNCSSSEMGVCECLKQAMPRRAHHSTVVCEFGLLPEFDFLFHGFRENRAAFSVGSSCSHNHTACLQCHREDKPLWHQHAQVDHSACFRCTTSHISFSSLVVSLLHVYSRTTISNCFYLIVVRMISNEVYATRGKRSGNETCHNIYLDIFPIISYFFESGSMTINCRGTPSICPARNEGIHDEDIIACEKMMHTDPDA